MQRFHAANAGTDNRTDTVPVFFIQIDAGIIDSQFGCCNGKLGRNVHVPCFFAINVVVCRVKIFDFTGNAGRVFRRIKMCNRANTVLAG